jgi:hypothetical protein
MLDHAVGAYEAAALMGVHFTRPKRLAEKGAIMSRLVASPVDVPSGREFTLFSAEECERDWAAYAEKKEAAGGKTDRRPRSYEDLRPRVLRHLAGIKKPILFGDAIGAAEVAEIMGIHWSFPQRMARAGRIVGRLLWSQRSEAAPAPRLWIFSRSSCLEELARVKKIEAAGKKVGRPRTGK